VIQFQALPEASSLAAANKRVSNILRKSAEETVPGATLDASALDAGAERELADQLLNKRQVVALLYQQANYTQALTELSTLKSPVDAFFDQVLIMVDDPQKRANRITLLTELRQLFSQVADIALLP